jgi:hypothetical protein
MANLNSREMAKIAVEKRLCKEYCDASKGVDNFIVYLNDGDEFQIQLFNPTNRVIGAKLKFNNEHKGWFSSDNYVVLRPGERVWLERFLDCHDKFIFNTYEVSNSSQVMEAIKDNGDITVQFYYEDESSRSRGITVSQPLVYTEPFTFAPQHTYYCSDSISDISGSITCGTNSCVNTLGFASSATTLTSNADTASSSYSTATSTAKSLGKARSAKTVETGRVEHGSYSSQNFKNVYYEFENWPFATKNFKLLPVSRKQYSDSDLRKVYCTNCGKKLSPKFKFCPVCGTKVNG